MSGFIGATIRLLLVTLGAWGMGALNREDSRPGFFGLAQWLTLGMMIAAGTAMTLRGEWLGAAYVVAACVLAWPWAVARRWLIPRGWWRASYWLVRSSAWSWHDDPRGGALVAAAWAGMHSRDPVRAAAFVEARCEKSECGASHLLAAGLAAAARGNLDDARRWIDSLCDFEGVARPRLARQLAVQWSAADAAARGDWTKVARYTGDRDADAATNLLTTVARRLLGVEPVPTDDEIDRAWKQLGRATRWHALVQHAQAATSAAARWPTHAEPSRDASRPGVRAGAITVDLRRDALLAHARVVASERPSVVALLAAAEAWDDAFDNAAIVAALRDRGHQLGARVDPVMTLRAQADGDLAAVALRHRLALGEDESSDRRCASRVRRVVHQRLLDELEVVADALHSRVEGRRALAIHEEWREYLTIRGMYVDAVAMTGPRLQRLAYALVNRAVTSLAVWLWNDRSNRVHAHQMFLWLLAEARKADDVESILLHTRNVAAGR